jgi:ABC-type long-subunit fatty acid transport system fused permease/ATPase subunit
MVLSYLLLRHIVTPSNPQLTAGRRRLRHRLHELFIFISLFFKSVIVVFGICLCVIILSSLLVDFLAHWLFRSPNARLRLGLEKWRLLLHISGMHCQMPKALVRVTSNLILFVPCIVDIR